MEMVFLISLNLLQFLKKNFFFVSFFFIFVSSEVPSKFPSY